MARRDKKRRIQRKKRLFVLISIALICFTVFMMVVLHNLYLQNKSNTENSQNTQNTLSFPYTTEDEQLQFTALIQFTGPNPDAENADGEDTAGLQIKNISGQYIKEADIKVQMNDGTEYIFQAMDIPAGKEIVAFDISNQNYDGQTGCSQIECEVKTSDLSMREDAVTVSTEGSGLMITNISEQEITDAVVIYRCASGDSYIGGISYEITVSELAAGESFTYEDSACLMGTPEAVGVEIK